MGSEPARRLHREDWLLHALETLRREGVTGLRVEPLAKSLGVTTGSFYWHFKDRKDLLDQVLAHWTEEMTAAVGRRMSSEEEPRKQLHSLLVEITRENRNRYETAMRNWAAFDTEARKSVL
jgi:AcrR family transcriptional regulator